MDLIYENKLIKLNINECISTDNLGSRLDSLEVSFADIKNECTTWEFKKGDSIEIIDSPFSTGKMYVDEFFVKDNIFYVKALSIKKNYKTKKSRSWEKVSFIDVANDIANNLGLELKTYGIKNYIYDRVDQIEQSDLEFIYQRCIFEGYIMKINNNRLNIISEKYIESQKPVITYSSNDFIGRYEFKCTSKNIFGGCEIYSNLNEYIKGSYLIVNSTDDILKFKNIYVSSLEEANRFAKNILHSYNKYEYTGSFIVEKNNNIAAGNTVKIDKFNGFNGVYVVESISNYFNQNKIKLKVRKLLEGY